MLTAIGMVICAVGMLLGYSLFRMLLGLSIVILTIAAFGLVYVAFNEEVVELQPYTRDQLLLASGLLGAVVGFVLAPFRAIQQGLDAADKPSGS
ncbi:hypothetical protein [Tuwongella immobilis]|uniref:Uncharacterized protein n=1 Tax=Tuwongella immobilis TaxID=692036 RepID=A0A6C2YQY2_9BACT|nr:hypothetical protein [Tuwongella immobilis]VIP03292.1 unnamed protein product [Tuwongella immobilis]VTS03955.1 unnamed protein product [Tuwongella immobilis]